MNKVILELDSSEVLSGYITAEKIDEKGQRRGKMPVNEVADLLRRVFDFDAAGRQVKMISRFVDSPFLGWGQNGAKWQALKLIPAAGYYLVSATGIAYPVSLPKLVAFVGNYISWPRIFWTDAEEITLKTRVYPLIIGNTYDDGRVCTGNTGLKCKSPDEIDAYVRKLLESQASHTVTQGTDKQYEALTKEWDPGIGKKHGITLEKLLASTE